MADGVRYGVRFVSGIVTTDRLRTESNESDDVAIAQVKTISLYNSEGIVVLPSTHTEQIRSITFSSTGLYLASVADDKFVNVFDVKSRELISQYQFEKKLTSAVFSGSTLIVADRFGVVSSIADVTDSGSAIAEILGHIETVHALTILHEHIISGDIDCKLRCSHYPSAYDIQSFCYGHHGAIVCLYGLAPLYVISGGEDGMVAVWNVESGALLCSVNCDGAILSFAYSPANRVLAVVVSDDPLVHLYQTSDEFELQELQAIPLKYQPISIVFSSCNQLLVASGDMLESFTLGDGGEFKQDAEIVSVNRHMKAIAEHSNPAPFVFEELSRKKEAEKRQAKRAKLAGDVDAAPISV